MNRPKYRQSAFVLAASVFTHLHAPHAGSGYGASGGRLAHPKAPSTDRVADAFGAEGDVQRAKFEGLEDAEHGWVGRRDYCELLTNTLTWFVAERFWVPVA